MRKTILIFLVIVVAVMGFAGCEKAVVPVEPIEVNFGYLSGPIALSVLQMVNDNPNMGDQVTVNYEMITSPAIMTGKMTAGDVDIAILATSQAALLYNKGIDYQVAAPSIWGALYLMGTSELPSVADLAGQDIALIGQGLTPDIIVRHILKENGLNPDEDVNLVYLATPQELLQNVLAGKYQYAVLPEPLASTAQLKKADLQVLLDFQAEWAKTSGASSYPQSSLVVKKSFAEANPELLADILEAYRASIEWANNNVEILGQYAEELEIGIPAAVVVKSLAACNIRFELTSDVQTELTDYLQTIYEIMPEAICSVIPDDGFYYSGQ